jgi:hypothetical protein
MENKLNHNPKQTAVNWVIGEIMRHQMTMYGTASMPLYILEKGIQMEKEQMEDAQCGYIGGWEEGEFDIYYKETYEVTNERT